MIQDQVHSLHKKIGQIAYTVHQLIKTKLDPKCLESKNQKVKKHSQMLKQIEIVINWFNQFDPNATEHLFDSESN